MHFKIVNCRLCEFLLDFFFFKVVLFNVVIIYEPEGGRGGCPETFSMSGLYESR